MILCATSYWRDEYYTPRVTIGAWLLVLFLAPVTFVMHDFWAVKDPMMAQMPQVMFLKNVSMLGGALFISHFGAGPLSLDARMSVHSTQGRGRTIA